MNPVVHRAETRGFADHGWLKTSHTFSFAQYHDPQRMGFGLLRVLNDDIVEPSRGFGTHPHEEMEIVSIPLTGSLRHQDSEGNHHLIRAGDVQIMSAGTGIRHSEHNASDGETINFLQIWILPKKRGIAPRYGQNTFDPAQRRNRFQIVVAPEGEAGKAIGINQDAWFSLAEIETGARIEAATRHAGNGLYLFIIEGRVQVAGEELGRRDGIGIADPGGVTIEALAPATVLAIDVPMR